MSSKFRPLGDCLLVRIAWRSCTRSVSNFLIVLPHEDYRGKPRLSDASLDPRSLWASAVQKGVGSVAWHKIFGYVKLLTYPLFLHLEKLVIRSRSPNLSWNHFASLITQSEDGQHNFILIYLTRLSPLHVHLPYERPLFGERCIVHDTHLVRRLPLAWATRRQRTHWPAPRHRLYLYLMRTITISMAIVAHDITTIQWDRAYTFTHSFTIDCKPFITKHGFTMVLLTLGC